MDDRWFRLGDHCRYLAKLMQYKSLFSYYKFGACCRFLQDATTSHVVKGASGIEANITSFMDYLEKLGLPVTKSVAESLLCEISDELAEYDEGSKLKTAHAAKLVKAVGTIRTTLDAEIQNVGAYTPTAKRLDLKKLMDAVPKLFAPGVFDNLPEIARFDLNEAGKCIAFERPTAAAFHILRATEDVLRFYYRTSVRSKRIKSLNWGPIVTDLRKRTRTKKYEILNNHLDNIRASFRNPTQHPEATYDIHEVQDVWSVCVDVINRMVKTLKKEDLI